MRALTLALTLAAAAAAGPANATMYFFETTLAGTNEFPANASPGTGSATLLWDDFAHTATYDITFSGLLGNTTASHTHSRTPGQPGPNFTVATTTPTYTGFPLGVTAGTYHHVFDTSLATSYNPAYVTAFGGVPQAEAALLAGLNLGEAYLNSGNATAAAAAFKKALQIDPDNARARDGYNEASSRVPPPDDESQ